LAAVIRRKRKQNFAFLVRGLHVLLLIHVAFVGGVVLPSIFDQLGGLTSSVVEYVISFKEICQAIVEITGVLKTAILVCFGS